jgi:uncharacterized protein YkwD
MNIQTLPRIAGAVLLSTIVIGSVTGCQQVGNPTAPDAAVANGGNATADMSADLAFCVSEINRLRATVGAPALAQSGTIETFSNEAAQIDGGAHETHKHFRDTNGGHGTAMAENEIPWWNISDWSSVHNVIRQGLATEWAEGPGGSHYENMTGRYTQVACGISVKGNEVTVTQDFK